MGGSNVVSGCSPQSNCVAAAGVYGIKYQYSVANLPGTRSFGATWTDAAGNLWLFGGTGYDSLGTYGQLNDLWSFDSARNNGHGEWAWMGGSATANTPGKYGAAYQFGTTGAPGSRASAAVSTDSTGRLWIYGGQGYDSAGNSGFLDDLWIFDPAAGTHGEWAWMGGKGLLPCQSCGDPTVYGTEYQFAGANFPGGRTQAMSWMDAGGRFWLLDGAGPNSAEFQDLWVFDPSQGPHGEWAWMGGSSGGGNGSGTYGDEYQFEPANFPGFRTQASTWTDDNGRFWLFGGQGDDAAGNPGYLNDLWAFDPASGANGQWAWMGGSSTLTHTGKGGIRGQSGVYGTQFQFSPANIPGGRAGATAQQDKNGRVWLFGGYGFPASGSYDRLNDFWVFDPAQGANGEWAWVGGIKLLNCNANPCTGQPGVYGTEYQYVSGPRPGARDSMQSWMDAQGNLWLFGGEGFDSARNFGHLNDVWEMRFFLPQKISFPAFPSKLTYGVSPIELHATASSGLPVTYKLIAGPGALSGPNNSILTITSGGAAVVINAYQAGNTRYLPASTVAQGIWVYKAPLTVQPDVKTMLLGGQVPALTWSATGFVNLETSSVLTGTPQLTTIATSKSPLGQYPIVIARNTLSAANYLISLKYGQLTVSTFINPPTAISNILPGFVIAGSGPQQVTITGSNFLPSTTGALDGVAHPVTYVNSTTMLFPLTASDQASLAIHAISLTNPVSNGATASVNLPVLTVPGSMIGLSQLEAGDQSRLQLLIQKGRNGQPVTMVAIGGSITQGGGASDRAHGYFSLLGSWWNTTFPSSPATMIDAGVGGTGSDYGALRTPRDVLAPNPDLVIVEFAVNDKPLGPAVYDDTYEGLLRQLLDAPTHPAVILFFMMRYGEPFATTVNSAEPWQKIIGANYNAPMVSYYDAITPELANGDIPLSLIHANEDHPNDVGHAYAALFLQSALQNTMASFPPGTTPDPIPSTNVPLYSDHFEFTSLEDGIGGLGPQLTPTNNQGWITKKRFSNPSIGQPEEGLETSTPGSTLDFTVNGTDILLGYWRFEGPMGQVSVTVDGGPPMLVDGWVNSVNAGLRSEARIGTGLAPGNHQIHLVLLPTKDAGSTGTTFRVLSVGTGGVQ
jgi:hypothetical protein